VRVENVRIKNFANIRKIDLDVAALGAGIVSVIGPNGSGKTHLLNALAIGPLYRRLYPWDVFIQEHFSADGSLVSTTLKMGQNTFEVTIRGVKNKTPECFLNRNGVAIAGPGVREFDQAVRTYFPPPELIQASLFSAQHDSDGFLSMDNDKRQKIYAKLMGLEIYDNYGNAVKVRLRDVKSRLDEIQILHDGISQTTITVTTPAYMAETAVMESTIQTLQEEIDALKKEIAEQKQQFKHTTELYISETNSIHQIEKKNLSIATVGEAAQKAAHQAQKDMQGVDLSLEICQKCPLTQTAQRAIGRATHTDADLFSLPERTVSQKEYQNVHVILSQLEQKLSHKNKTLDDMRADVLQRNRLAERYQAEHTRREEHEKRLNDLGTEYSALRVLQQSIDTSRRAHIGHICPEIARICNELLSQYRGGRFSIVLQTEAPKKAQKEGFRENFTPLIHDACADEVRQDVSGGEGAIISTALKMAFAVANARQNGLEAATFVLDEPAAPVDEECLPAYMAILRSGLSIFSNIIIVSHTPQIYEQTDAQIYMDNGEIIDIC
jgi:DNA repair exonuclease SbcCD ATPase subunit